MEEVGNRYNGWFVGFWVKYRFPDDGMHALMKALRISIWVHGLPSTVNRFAGCFPRTWDPRDIRAMGAFMKSIWKQYQLEEV